MRDLLTRNCAYCGEPFSTYDQRKVFCTKQHADRSRNLPRLPIGAEGSVNLKDFNRFSSDIKQRILSGELGDKIVTFDLECTSLKPTVGRILCASFKPLGEKAYTFSAIDRRFRRPDVFDDSKLARAIREELEKFDVIVSWNGKEFDVKFLNSRLMRGGERTKNPQYHIDGMWSWRSKASAWSKLDAVQKFLGTGTEKTDIEWQKWMQALGWDKKLREEAMASIVEHCEHDVTVLEDVYLAMTRFNVFRSLRLDGGIL